MSKDDIVVALMVLGALAIVLFFLVVIPFLVINTIGDIFELTATERLVAFALTEVFILLALLAGDVKVFIKTRKVEE